MPKLTRLRRLAARATRSGVRSLPPDVREVALTLAARTVPGPALLPGPPEGGVLVLAPHPDDETIGAGGVIARHAARGDAVTVLVATSGEATTGGFGDVAAAREAECRAACADLGVTASPVFCRLPDGGLAQATDELRAAIGSHLDGVATVYVPSLLDPHPDHRAANVALAAAEVDAVVMGYEVWAAAPVDVVIDVAATWEHKARALGRYATALASVDYVHAIGGLAAYRSASGGLGGAGRAEAFLRLDAATHAELVTQLRESHTSDADHG